jgi:hypothetical protein
MGNTILGNITNFSYLHTIHSSKRAQRLILYHLFRWHYIDPEFPNPSDFALK